MGLLFGEMGKGGLYTRVCVCVEVGGGAYNQKFTVHQECWG